MEISTCDLSGQRCKPCEGGVPPLAPLEIERLLQELPGWELSNGSTGTEGSSGSSSEISKVYAFKNYYETMAFVNASAWISHRENHHPDLEVGYQECRVRYSTHAIGGLSENDFICAAKLDRLLSAP